MSKITSKDFKKVLLRICGDYLQLKATQKQYEDYFRQLAKDVNELERYLAANNPQALEGRWNFAYNQMNLEINKLKEKLTKRETKN